MLIDFFYNKPRLTVFLLLIITLFGIQAYSKISKEEIPEVKVPYIFVSVPYEGVSPEDAEKILLKPLETELKSIEGIKKITSYAVTGMGSVIIEFYAGLDNEKALRDVKDKIDIAKAKLPLDAKEPIIKEIDFSKFPVLNILLKSKELDENQLIYRARELKDRIEKVPSVLQVNIAGDKEDSVEILIDRRNLEAYKITAQDLLSLDLNNKLVTTGNIQSKTSDFSIKLPALIKNPSEINKIPIKTYKGKIIRIADIGEVKKTYKTPKYIARADGANAIVLEISKRSGKNVIDTIKQVRQIVDSSEDITANTEVIYSRDSSESIMNSISNLNNELALAGLIVIVTVIFFIGIKQSFLISLTIPISFFLGILGLYLMGYTLNIVVLFALILSIGMVVDGGSVVVEYAFQKMKEGISHQKAYLIAAKRMFLPVFVSTLTVLVAYMPLLFWPGVVGKFMKYLPITLIFVLTASLAAAIIFLPIIGGLFGKIEQTRLTKSPIQMTPTDLEALNGYKGWYIRTIKQILLHPVKTSLIVIFITISSFFVYGKFQKGVIFFPKIEPETAQVIIRTRGNLSLNEKDRITKLVENRILTFKKYVRVFYTRVGNVEGISDLPKDTIAVIDMDLQPWDLRPSAQKVFKEMQNLVSDIAGVVVEIQEEKQGPPASKDIVFEIKSNDFTSLNTNAENILNFIKQDPDFIDTEDSRPLSRIEYSVDINKELVGLYGLNIADIGAFVRLITNGMKVTSFRPDYAKDEVDILFRFKETQRKISTLNSLNILTSQGKVPLINVAEIKPVKEVSEIYRVDSKRTIIIKTNVKKGISIPEKIKILEGFFKNLNKTDIKFIGEQENQKETADFLQTAFLVVLLITLVILVGQFNSFTKMLIVMSSVIFSISGVLLAFLLWQRPFVIVMTGLGIVSLVGIVVNNNIILIDMLKEVLETEKDYKTALLKTALSRLDAILITTLTTIIGILPSAFGISVNFLTGNFTIGSPPSQWWIDLSITIVGGLTFATLISLFYTPCLLLIEHKIRSRIKQFDK